MGKSDFFDGLGETITKTAKELGERAEQIYEAQKIRNKISGEERIVEKVKADIGNLIFKKYENGEAMDSELSVLCEEIRQHLLKIREYKEAAADIKGQKICPSCEKAVDRGVSYCPYCGAACPAPEEPETEVVEEDECGSCEPAGEADEQPVEEASEQSVEEATAEAAEEAAEAAEEVTEAAEEVTEKAAEE